MVYNAIQQQQQHQPQQQQQQQQPHQQTDSRAQMADDGCKNNNVTDLSNRSVNYVDNNHLLPGENSKYIFMWIRT